MSQANIENAIKAMIGGAISDWSIAWPNQDMPNPAPFPRLEVFIDRASNRSISTTQFPRVSLGLVRVLVVVEKNTSTFTANDKADEVSRLMDKGAVLVFSGGHVTFTDNADIRAGFPDGSSWVVPVIGKYEAIENG